MEYSITGGRCHKYDFCLDQSCLSRQNTSFVATKLCVATKYFCPDRTFVATNIYHDKHNFVATDTCLSRQFFFYFVATELCKYHFCRHKGFVATNILLSLQKFCLDTHTFCRDKRRVFRDKHMFVATNTCLSRQK